MPQPVSMLPLKNTVFAGVYWANAVSQKLLIEFT